MKPTISSASSTGFSKWSAWLPLNLTSLFLTLSENTAYELLDLTIVNNSIISGKNDQSGKAYLQDCPPRQFLNLIHNIHGFHCNHGCLEVVILNKIKPFFVEGEIG